MVQAADLLLLTDLKALCCQFLESCIAAENCVGIRLFALHYCLHHVHHVATEYLQTHFRDVAASEEFSELPPDRLCELLSMEKLNVGNEKHVLEAVVRWLAHDLQDRRVRAPVHPVGIYFPILTSKLYIIPYHSHNFLTASQSEVRDLDALIVQKKNS